MSSKPKVKITLKGNLGKYSTKLKLQERRKELIKLIKTKKKDYAPIKILRRLNVLYIFNKNKNPELAQKFRRDFKYVKKYIKDIAKKLDKKNN
jgi:hypothetical protein